MASKLRAGSGFPYVLKEDRGEVTEPQFILRVLSADDSDTINGLREQYIAAEDRLKKRELRLAMLRLAMFEQREDVTAILTESECWELISGAIIGAVLSTEERKKFVLPQQLETDRSASDAAANVSTE